MRAAMRVLGAVPKDFEAKPRDDFESEIRYNHFESKRRQIIEQTASLAAETPEAADIPDAAAKAAAQEAAFFAEVDHAEKASVAKMKIMAKKDIQSTMIKELEIQNQALESAKKMEANKARHTALLKERDKALKEAKKIAEKNLEKSNEVRRKADEQLKGEAKHLGEELATKSAAVDAKLQEIADSRVDGRLRKQEKRAQAWERKEKHEASLDEKARKAYDKLLERDQDVNARMDSIHSVQCNNSAVFAEKLKQCTDRAEKRLQTRQQAIEDNYVKTCDRHKESDNLRAKNLQDTTTSYKVRNSRERSVFETRYSTLQSHEKEESTRPSKRMLRSQSLSETGFQCTGCQTRPEYLHVLESNKSMVDIVEFNRQMLRRAHGHHQEQELARLAGMSSKTQALLDSRIKTGQRRMEMLKNTASEKHTLDETVERARTAPPAKMVQIVADMDPDPEAARVINELLGKMNMDLLPGFKLEEAEDK